MKTDTAYSSIDVCPETGDQLSNTDVYYNDGVCPHCGHSKQSSITHHDQIVGRWVRPNLYERIFQRKQVEFLTKEDEDKVWGGLKSE